MTLETKWGMRIFIINLIVTVVGFLIFGYMFYLDGDLVNKAVEYEQFEELQVEKEVYSPGEVVRLYNKFCKYRDAEVAVSWALIDTIVRFYPEKVTTGRTGCYGYEGRAFEAVTIPPDVFDGTYHLEATVRVKINPVKTITYNFSTEEFQIINPNK
jgi:hypothetical protein